MATENGPTPTTLGERPTPAIDGYSILGELGRGGMGVVYRAHHVRLNRPCALKMILAGNHTSSEDLVRFLSEAQTIAQLHHANIVQIHHIGESDGLPFFELEYVEGGSLDKQLDGIPWTPRRAAELVEAMAVGITEMHRLGIVHRDLKPGNVLLAPDGTPKIADFGLAKSQERESGLTRTGWIIGSPGYMAPEQAEGLGQEVGPMADIHALGAILYELLTGRPPFRGSTVLETLNQARLIDPVSPSRLVPGLPRDIETIVMKCLRKDPDKRYASAEALATDLRRYLEGRPITARPVAPIEHLGHWCRRNPAIAALTGLTVMLLILTAGVTGVAYARTSSALAEAVGSLYHSLVREARALRSAREVGYRDEVFDRLVRAARLNTPERDLAELRIEAVACLGDFVGLRPRLLDDLGPGPSAVAVHPRSQWVAVGLRDGSVRLYDRSTGEERARLTDSSRFVTALSFEADGTRLLVGHDDGTIQVVDDLAAQPPRVTQAPRADGFVSQFVRTTDGRTLVVVTAWDLKGFAIRDVSNAGSEAQRITFGKNLRGGTWEQFPRPGLMAISPDGRRAATCVSGSGAEGGAAQWVVLWDLTGLRELRSLPVPYNATTYELAFSPDGSQLAIGYDGGFSILTTEDLTVRFAVRLDSAMALRFSPDGRTLAVGTITRQVQLWSLTTNRILAELKHPARSQLWQVAFSDDGRTLASVSYESVQLWDLVGASERRELEGHAGGVTGVAFSPDGATLASSSMVGNVKLWEPATGRLARTLAGYPGDVQSCAFTPDGSFLVTGSKENARLRSWETRSWEEASVATFPDLHFIFFLSIRPNAGPDPWLLAASGYGLRIWGLGPKSDGGVEVRPIASQPADRSLSVALSPDGARAAFVEDSIKVRIWDRETDRVRPISGPDLLNGWHALAFRSDRELVFVTKDGIVVVWDVIADRQVRSIGRPGQFESNFVAVSPDGRWLAAEATPSSVAIVDLERGEATFRFREERSPIWSLAWSQDARRLGVGLSDGGLVVWDLDEVRERLTALGLN